MTLEELGYLPCINDGELYYELHERSVIYTVVFYFESRSFETFGEVKGSRVNHPINMELYEAIENKLKELEWL